MHVDLLNKELPKFFKLPASSFSSASGQQVLWVVIMHALDTKVNMVDASNKGVVTINKGVDTSKYGVGTSSKRVYSITPNF